MTDNGGRMIIGLTGTFAAGKDTVADYLEKKGFEHFSTGEEVAEIAREKGIETTRDNLRELANKLRDEFGPDYLSRRVIEHKAKTDKVVVTGLRQPGEIQYLIDRGNFVLIAIDAPIELRFKRMAERKRPGDPESLESMEEKEQKEMQNTGKNAQKIHKCMKMAVYTIINDGSFEDLYKKIDELISKIENGQKK